MSRCLWQTVFFCFLYSSLWALQPQGREMVLTGSVSDALTGEPLPGASIRVLNSGTTSGPAGTYTLRFTVDDTTTLLSVSCSYVGYAPQTIDRTIDAHTTALEQHFMLAEGNLLLETATVTGGRYRRSLGEVTVSLEVLPLSVIEYGNAISLDEALEKIPSLHITDGQVNIRGGSGYAYGAGSRVLLLIDDMPYLQADAGFPNWNDIPIENIGQVEVLKGAASALYGSSALNGVINIQTALPSSKPSGSVSVFTRIYDNPADTTKVWWNTDTTSRPAAMGVQGSVRLKTGRNNKLDFVAGINHTRENSFRLGDDTRYTRVSLFNRWRISDRSTLGLNVNINQSEGGTFLLWAGYPEKALIPLPGSNSESNSLRFTVDPRFTYFDGAGNRHRLLTRYFYTNNRVDQGQSNQADFLFGEYQFQREFEPLSLVFTSGITASHTVSRAELYGDTIISASNLAAYVQMEKKFFDRLTLSGGMRYEHHFLDAPEQLTGDSIAGRAGNEGRPVFRIGASYRLAEATFIRASWGQGYRFPTIAEKFVRTQVGPLLNIYPNPGLVSETGWSAEVGLRQGLRINEWSGYADLSVFWTEYSDMMEFLFGYNQLFGFTSANVGNTRIRGMEISLGSRGRLGAVNLDILGGYTYIDPEFRPFTEQDDLYSSADYNVLKYRHRHLFKMDIQAGWNRFEAGMAANIRTPFEAVDHIFVVDALIPGARQYREENHSILPTWDFRAAVSIIPSLKLSFVVQNAFNFDLMVRPGIHEAPRAYNIRLDWKW